MAIHDQVNDPINVQLERHEYPLPATVIHDLVDLLRTEWTRTDFDWLEAMHGDYSHNLVITSVVARQAGRAISTASVLYSRRNPDVALLSNVVTRREYRGQGIGGRVVEAAVALAEQAGGRVCLLGTQATTNNVYRRHGFDWHRGAVMRRTLNGPVPLESDYFRLGQDTTIRPAHWGDMPGVTLLAVQSLEMTMLDYPRGIMSGKSTKVERCVSLFPLLMSDVRTHGGTLAVLCEPTTGHILGFASVTIGAGAARRHTATVEFATHDHYLEQAASLVQWLLDYCERNRIVTCYAYVAEVDASKRSILEQLGFETSTKLSSALVVNGESVAVTLLRREDQQLAAQS